MITAGSIASRIGIEINETEEEHMKMILSNISHAFKLVLGEHRWSCAEQKYEPAATLTVTTAMPLILPSDLDNESSGVHDVLYAYPVMDDGKRLSKVQVDIIYGQLLYRAADNTKRGSRWYSGIVYHVKKRHRKMASFFRPFVLYFAGDQAWDEHRRTEKKLGDEYQAWMHKEYYVPDKDKWEFPSVRTKDAVWIG